MVNLKGAIPLVAGSAIFLVLLVFQEQIRGLLARVQGGGQLVAQGGTVLGGVAGNVFGAPLYAVGAGISTFTQAMEYFAQHVQKLFELPSIKVGSSVKCYDSARNVIPCP